MQLNNKTFRLVVVMNKHRTLEPVHWKLLCWKSAVLNTLL